MNILIATTCGSNFHNAVVQFLQNLSTGETSITLISIVEPSPIVDFSLSVSGETLFKHILDRRISAAESDMNTLRARLTALQATQPIQSTTVVGFKTEVVRQRAQRIGADLILVSAADATHLVSHSPCTVIALKPIPQSA